MTTEYHRAYLDALAHQREHGGRGNNAMFNLTSNMFGDPQPWQMCMECLHERAYPRGDTPEGRHLEKWYQRKYAWAIPNDQAIATIAEHSPAGVIEIGAGAGYWCYELQSAGVDALAYDPEPPGFAGEDTFWHMNVPWTAVHPGDHTVAAKFPERTLLIVWPSYGGSWASEAVETHYQGDTVILVGEGHGGCTGDDRLFELLGDEHHCDAWWDDDQNCECDVADPQWRLETEIDIPQWFGLRDYMAVYKRV